MLLAIWEFKLLHTFQTTNATVKYQNTFTEPHSLTNVIHIIADIYLTFTEPRSLTNVIHIVADILFAVSSFRTLQTAHNKGQNIDLNTHTM